MVVSAAIGTSSAPACLQPLSGMSLDFNFRFDPALGTSTRRLSFITTQRRGNQDSQGASVFLLKEQIRLLKEQVRQRTHRPT